MLRRIVKYIDSQDGPDKVCRVVTRKTQSCGAHAAYRQSDRNRVSVPGEARFGGNGISPALK